MLIYLPKSHFAPLSNNNVLQIAAKAGFSQDQVIILDDIELLHLECYVEHDCCGEYGAHPAKLIIDYAVASPWRLKDILATLTPALPVDMGKQYSGLAQLQRLSLKSIAPKDAQ